MSEAAPNVLQRKAALARMQPDFGVVTPLKALRLGVSRAAQDILRTPLVAQEIEESRVTLTDLGADLSEGSLSLLLQGPGRARGLVSLDASALGAVIQAQTLGRVLNQKVEPRVPTSTDAMLARRFLGLFVSTFGTVLNEASRTPWAEGFATRELVENARRIPHLLSDVAYRHFSITVDIASGLRDGRIDLVLPVLRDVDDDAATDAAGVEATDWSAALGRNILDSASQLNAILYRFRFSLSEVAAMRPGDLLELPGRALSEVSLEAANGEITNLARLGQVEGLRALRVSGGDWAAHPAATDQDGFATTTRSNSAEQTGETLPAVQRSEDDAQLGASANGDV